MVLVVGEAESHCARETLEDIVDEFRRQEEQLDKIYVLQDCMSPVRHPDRGFHTRTMKRFRTLADYRLHFIESTDLERSLEAIETHEINAPAPRQNQDGQLPKTRRALILDNTGE